MTPARTLYDKHIDSHTVCRLDDQGHVLLYIDRQVINEYTSPQAFSGLREAKRGVWRAETALAVVSRVLPQMNVFVVGVPVKIVVGLAVFALTMGTLQPVMARVYASIFIYWEQVLS